MRSFMVCVCLAACGGGSGDAADAGPDARQGDPEVSAGRFSVELIAPTGDTPGLTQVVGTVYDGPQPEAIIWNEAQRSGDCVLLTPQVPFCSTPCGGSAVCVADDTCQPYAEKQAVGTVHAAGIHTTGGASAFDMEPVVGSYQPPAGVQLAYPAFAPGEAISLAASGSAFTGPFTLTGSGIAPLELTSADPALTRGSPLELTWTQASGGATIEVRLDISHHGGSKGKIECSTGDSGSLAIAAPLVDALLDLGAAGFPTIVISRQAITSTVVSSGRVELVIDSQVERPVTVPGVISCTGTQDCPEGMTCQPDLTCQ